ncbi:MAG: alpha/beta fold hydrolase [Methylophagaceae bacterium]
MKLNYQLMGAGQPLVILHGLFGSSDNWRGPAKQLSNYAQVIVVDLRNHGHSPHSAQQTYRLMANDLAELLDDLHIARTNIIGHSIGGKMAMCFAEYHANRVNKLMVVDIAPRQYADEHSAIFKALLALDLSQYEKRSEVDAALSESIEDQAVRQFLLMNLEAKGKPLNWRVNVQALYDNYPELMGPVCQQQTIMTASCFIRGSRSNYINNKDEALIKGIFPNSELYMIDQAGHWVHADKPIAFLQKVMMFFDYD